RGPAGVRGDAAFRGEAVDEAAEYGAVGGADPVAGRGGVREPCGFLLELLGGGEEHSGAGEHQFAQPGRAGAVPVALEEGTAEHPFDALELGGEGGLGQPERGSGLADTSGVRDGADDLEVPELEVHNGKVTVSYLPNNAYVSGNMTDIV